MDTDCYAMIRGSGLRVTDLDTRGRYDAAEITYAVSKSVSKVTITETIDGGGNEVLRTPEQESRLHFVTSATTLRYNVGVDFLRCDPGILSLVSGMPVVENANGDIVGFDSNTRVRAKAFALEVWTRLAGENCVVPGYGFGEGSFGEDPFGGGSAGRLYGYTLFPFLKGGVLSGFAFQNGLVSFNLQGARTQRGSKWGVGPYDLEGPYERLLDPVSRNTSWKSFKTLCPPPAAVQGIQTLEDIIYGGDVAGSTPDILDGNTGPYVVIGGA